MIVTGAVAGPLIIVGSMVMRTGAAPVIAKPTVETMRMV